MEEALLSIARLVFLSSGVTALGAFLILKAMYRVSSRQEKVPADTPFETISNCSFSNKNFRLSLIFVLFFGAIVWILVYLLVYSGGVPSLYRTSTLAPASDAFGYYNSAIKLVSYGSLDDHGRLKPLFPVFLAALIRVIGTDSSVLFHALAIMTLMSMLILVAIVHHYFGVLTSLLWIALAASFFGSNIAALFMSESLGFILGCLAASCLLPALFDRYIWLVFPGILLQSMALSARPGPFFVLPVLILWSQYRLTKFTSPLRFISILRFIGLILCAIAPFFLNSLLLRTFEAPLGVGFWNFALTLYGLTHGGPWDLIFNHYPELRHSSAPELSQAAYYLSYQQLLYHPLVFLKELSKGICFFIGEGGLLYFNGDSYENLVYQLLFFAAPIVLMLANLNSGVGKSDDSLFLSVYQANNQVGRTFAKEWQFLILLWLSFVLSLGFLMDGGYRTRVIAACWWILPLYACTARFWSTHLSRMVSYISIDR